MFMVCLVVGAAAAHADTRPLRVVSAGGDLTEIVYALGAGDRLVGVDSTSRHPGETQKKAQIGYVRRVSAEGVLSLKPDLVLGANDLGPPPAVEQLRATGVRVAIAPEGDSPDGVLDKILFVGRHLGLDDEARRLAGEIREEMTRAIETAAKSSRGRKVIFVLSVGDSGVLVGGENTAADAIIRLAGGENAARGFEGYKPMSRESILQAQPEVVLMMKNRQGGHRSTDRILDRPEFSMTPAVASGSLVTMDGLLLLGFGPRTPKAVAELSSAINR
ncbi:MAG: ABC transporter substrate-binding protein [Rhodospirillales bacterium]|nr:ABC transporter substrate-binding protein [Rhodospirillales bacterium]MBO6785705.1 ABC transporter substrate-binding protein [Rhodospirillales bacterium]